MFEVNVPFQHYKKLESVALNCLRGVPFRGSFVVKALGPSCI